MKVTEIAESVGYDDVLTFSRLFSRETGVSPTCFRDQKICPADITDKL